MWGEAGERGPGFVKKAHNREAPDGVPPDGEVFTKGTPKKFLRPQGGQGRKGVKSVDVQNGALAKSGGRGKDATGGYEGGGLGEGTCVALGGSLEASGPSGKENSFLRTSKVRQ